MNPQNVKLMYVIVVSLELLGGNFDVDPVGFEEELDVVFSVVQMTGVLVVGCWVVLVLEGVCVVDTVGLEEDVGVVGSFVGMTVVLVVVNLDVVEGEVIFAVVVVDEETEVFVVGVCEVLDDVVIFVVVCTVVLVVVSFTYQANAVNDTKKSFVLSKAGIEYIWYK